ncbi:uncharacterized protein LOC123565603 [Mercenaria mercenaria]|uniref:uncharacterized protein LOC123565603 n=1 Tax=Mercenaria mercenaria TaxID=6596 RepID=UPI00234EEB2E|nr:uncharacterized protein LOC123565603 [Mercenaria mercenaria]
MVFFQQLHGIPCSLEALAMHLKKDYDIQKEIRKLISDARTLCKTFVDIMATNRTEVLNKKHALMVVTHPSEVDVQNLKMALKAMQDAIKTVRDGMFVFQASVHKRIEECRARIRQHNNTIEIEKIKVTRLRIEMRDLERQISDCEKEAKIQEESAERCEENARTLSREADKLKAAGILSSGITAGVGVLFAPFTGGLSLAVAGGAVVGSMSVILYKVSQWNEMAGKHRQRANEIRSDVARHRQTKASLERDTGEKEMEINSLEKKNDKLSMTCGKLNDIEKQLLTAISVINQVTKHVQDLDTTLYATEHQGDSFRIIQNASNRKPEKLEGIAQEYLKELKEKWECVEKDLVKSQELRS